MRHGYWVAMPSKLIVVPCLVVACSSHKVVIMGRVIPALDDQIIFKVKIGIMERLTFVEFKVHVIGISALLASTRWRVRL